MPLMQRLKAPPTLRVYPARGTLTPATRRALFPLPC